LIRFALSITAIELALTVAASLWIALASGEEPYVTPGEFEMLGIPTEKHSTERRYRFGTLFSYDTQATVKASGPAITVSVRVHTPRSEFDARLAGERWPTLREGDEAPVITDEPWPGESGYGVRQRSRTGVRAEIVRLRGTEMLVVRAVRPTLGDLHPGHEVARCERLVRLLQDFTAQKLGWRETESR
jgi:hypothetical protein